MASRSIKTIASFSAAALLCAGFGCTAAFTSSTALAAQNSTVYYLPGSNYGGQANIHYGVNGTWTTPPGVAMEKACDNWLKKEVPANGQEIEITFNHNNQDWDNNGGKNYKASGDVISISNGQVSSTAPSCVVEDIAVTSVTISGAGVSGGAVTLQENATVQLSAAVQPANASNATVSWSSSNTGVATVSSTGLVSAKTAGTATITATAGGKSATVTVTVGAGQVEIIPVSAITIAGGDTTMKQGSTKTLSATITPANATNKMVTWSSSDPAIATVDANGKVTAKALGTTTITATADGKTTSITVTVIEATVPVGEIQITGPDTVVSSARFQLTLEGLAEPVATSDITWTTSNWRVISSSSFPANQGETSTWDAASSTEGEATITATIGDKTASKTIRVEKYAKYQFVESMTISGPDLQGTETPYKLTVPVGGTSKIDTVMMPEDATYKNTIWQSLNSDIVRINQDGTIRGIAPGTATVYVRSYGNRLPKQIEVTVSGSTPVIIPVESIALDAQSVSLKVGASASVKATVLPANATDPSVTWKSSNADVATVDNAGKITAKKAGVATITATAGTKSATVSVTVKDNAVVNPTDTFSDVPAGISFHDEIEWLATNKISQGYSDGRFGYYDNLNRQDMAIFLYRLAKLNGVGNAASYSPSSADYKKFSDVKQGSYAAKEILWLASTGITQGSNGKFNGTSKLTRQDMAIFLYRFAKLAGSSSANSYSPSTADYNKFSDVNKGTFAAKEILWLAKEGITLGNANGTFGGSSKLTRSAMAAFLYRTHNHINK